MGKEPVFYGKRLLNKLSGASSEFFKRQGTAAIKQLRAVVLDPGASKKPNTLRRAYRGIQQKIGISLKLFLATDKGAGMEIAPVGLLECFARSFPWLEGTKKGKNSR